MNTTTNNSKRYVWNGLLWSAKDEETAVCETGAMLPIEELMKALFNGDARAITPIVQAAPPVVEAGDIDEAGKARAAAKIEKAAGLGIALPASKADGLFYDLGTAVMTESWKAEREGFDAMKRGADVLPQTRDAIRAEDRADLDFGAWDLRMSPQTGKLGVSTEQSWMPTKRGLDSFCARADVGKVPDRWPTDIKANAINAVVKRFAADFKPESDTDAPPRVVLRVQRARGKAFAAVSHSYTAFDGDKVLEALLEALPADARCNVFYDPDAARGKVEVVTLQEEQPVVGEPFRTSFTISWDDTGGGAVRGDGGLWSARCLNLSRIWTSAGSFSIRHLGSVSKLARRFRSEFARIADVLHQFSGAYGKAAAEELTNAERIESAEFIKGIYRSLLERDLVPVRGRREQAVSDLALQFSLDENKMGLTRAGIANGITRYAHRVNQDPWARDDMERAAGRLLWAPRPVKLDYLAAEA